jgi:ketosteroid isomerase-like protein
MTRRGGAPAALQAAHEYVRRINRREYDSIADLFAPDAVFGSPLGTTIRGREAIGEFYRRQMPTLDPMIWITSTVTEGQSCVFEFEARFLASATPDQIVVAIDHFTVDDDGLLQQFTMYVRPDPAETEDP